jgi:hypothetical protein
MYLPGVGANGDGIAHMDLMVEITCLASALNVALPVAVVAAITAVVLMYRRKLPVFAACIVMVMCFLTVLPAIPLMNHFDAIHGEDIHIWVDYVWWIPQ